MVLGKSWPISSWCYDFLFPFFVVREHSGGWGQSESGKKKRLSKGSKVPYPWDCPGKKASIKSLCYNRKEWLGELLVPGLGAAQGDHRKEKAKLLRNWRSPVRIKEQVQDDNKMAPFHGIIREEQAFRSHLEPFLSHYCLSTSGCMHSLGGGGPLWAFSDHCVPPLPVLFSFQAPEAPVLHLVTCAVSITMLTLPVWIPIYHCVSEFLNWIYIYIHSLMLWYVTLGKVFNLLFPPPLKW